MATAEELVARLTAANTTSGSVGSVASVAIGGKQLDAAAGLVDIRENRPVSLDTPFRMGSIAKVCTAATLSGLLQGSGRSLHDPVVDLLPGAVPIGAAGTTWWHLLTHSSGIDGTFWDGFGDEPDAIGRYAARVPELPAVFDPGDSWGYSNSGFVLAGAAIEALAGTPYDEAVVDHVLGPLGLSASTLWSPSPPSDAAIGHHVTPNGPRPSDPPTGTRALAPTGSAGFATAANLLDLAEQLLADTWEGLAAEARSMPPGGGPSATHQSLGWRVYRWGDTVMFGHDGGAAGMGSFVRWIPATGSGIAVMSNTNPSAMLLWADLSRWFFELAGISVPPWLSAIEGARPEPELCGTYVARDATFTVTEGNEALFLEVDGLGGTLRRSVALEPLAPGTYRADQMVTDPTRIISFEQPRGAYRLLHAGPFTARA